MFGDNYASKITIEDVLFRKTEKITNYSYQMVEHCNAITKTKISCSAGVSFSCIQLLEKLGNVNCKFYESLTCKADWPESVGFANNVCI